MSEKKTLRKLIIYDELRENMQKFEYALKISQFIMVNRCSLFEDGNFIETACELLDLKLHKIDGTTYDFDGLLSRLLKL